MYQDFIHNSQNKTLNCLLSLFAQLNFLKFENISILCFCVHEPLHGVCQHFSSVNLGVRYTLQGNGSRPVKKSSLMKLSRCSLGQITGSFHQEVSFFFGLFRPFSPGMMVFQLPNPVTVNKYSSIKYLWNLIFNTLEFVIFMCKTFNF